MASPNNARFLAPESPAKIRRIEASPRKGMTELSPRRIPRSPVRPPNTPPNWKRPDEVMKLHRLKRQSLASRFSKCDSISVDQKWSKMGETNNSVVKRKNPFKVDGASAVIQSPKKCKSDSGQDTSSLFHLLGLADPQSNHRDPLNFESIIEKIKEQNQPKTKDLSGSRTDLPVDWSLRTKLRFMSTKPFPWNQTLKTCEEASGITGFVRCVNEDSDCLVTSPNTVFHQCCLYWQYPSFPWLTLYPRRTQDMMGRKATNDKTIPSFASHPQVKESLHNDFTESFRSVFQLLRARHCPYFYVAANIFTCLFRAAGVNGASELSAMVCPTTQGFRQLLRDNDIQFTLPLRQKEKKRRSGGDSSNGVDSELIGLDEEHPELDDDDGEDEGETREWLTKLGLPTKDLDKLNSPNNDSTVSSELDLDGSDESLVYVEGSEVSSLFNFLINFRSATASTGPAAGIPPTILSPVAFTRASLSGLQVRESVVKVDSERFYSMEICGPILPDTIHNMCDILHAYLDQFSVTFATDVNTKPFTLVVKNKGKEFETDATKNGCKEVKPGSAFCVQNLSDCGMKANLLPRFCSDDVVIIDCIKYSDQLYNIG